MKFFILAVAVVCMVFLRLWRLDVTPPGFFVDESSIALNGYTLLTQGTDEHGVALPVYFKAFGEYKNPLYIYAQVPVFALLGMTRFSTRLVAALFMLAAAGAYVLLLREYAPVKSRGRFHFLLLGALIFLGLPWTFHLGRVAFELATFPVFLLLSIWALRKVSVVKSSALAMSSTATTKYWLVFSLAQGILFYTYTVGRFLAPLLFCCALVLFYTKLRFKRAVIGLLLFCLVLLPAVGWELEHPGSLLSRYTAVANSNLQLTDMAVLYAKHLSPHFLFQAGDGNLRHGMLETGPFVWLALPLLILGIKYLFKHEKKQFALWIVAGMLVSPIPGLLTIPSPHTLRSIGLLVFLTYLIGLGFVRIWQNNKALFTAVIFLEMGVLLFFYFQQYAAASLPWYETQTVSALEQHITQEPQNYALSHSLYPGSYATAYFVYAQKTNQSLQEIRRAVQSQRISTGFLTALEQGTVFLSAAECRTFADVLTQEFELLEEKTDLCVWQKKQ